MLGSLNWLLPVGELLVPRTRRTSEVGVRNVDPGVPKLCRMSVTGCPLLLLGECLCWLDALLTRTLCDFLMRSLRGTA